MRKYLTVLTGILSLALVAWAGDPWKDKPYLQWDSRDIQRVMFESPWSQIVQVDAAWRSSEAAAQAAARKAQQTSGSSDMGGGMHGSAGAQMPSSSGNQTSTLDQSAQIPQVKFLVRWVSARVVREAMARNAITEGKMKEADAANALAEPTPGYVLLVAGPDMSPFFGAEEKDLRASAFLKPKKGKEKIAPIKVEIQRDPGTKQVISVFFTFPKKTGNGEAAIVPDEKGAEFVCVSGRLNLRASFDFHKMAGSQGLDL